MGSKHPECVLVDVSHLGQSVHFKRCAISFEDGVEKLAYAIRPCQDVTIGDVHISFVLSVEVESDCAHGGKAVEEALNPGEVVK